MSWKKLLCYYVKQCGGLTRRFSVYQHNSRMFAWSVWFICSNINQHNASLLACTIILIQLLIQFTCAFSINIYTSSARSLSSHVCIGTTHLFTKLNFWISISKHRFQITNSLFYNNYYRMDFACACIVFVYVFYWHRNSSSMIPF